MKKAGSVLDRLPGRTELDREGLRDIARGGSRKAAAEGRKAIGRGKRALAGRHAANAGQRARDNASGIAGAVTGLALLAGTVAFGVFLARRRKGGDDDAPGFTRKRPDSDHAVGGRTVTIRKPAAELYRFWRDFQNLPQFMENVEEVRPHGDHEAWVVKAPGGRTVELHTRVIEEPPDRLGIGAAFGHLDQRPRRILRGSWRTRNARLSEDRICAAGRVDRQGGGQALPARTRSAGAP